MNTLGGGMHAQNGGTIHVVCYDCSFESLVTDRQAARELVDHHEAETAHSTQFARID